RTAAGGRLCPPLAGEGEGTSPPLLATRFCARALPTPFPKPLPPHKRRGGGAPIGARVESAPALRMSTSEPAASAASATDVPRYRGHPLAGALAFRRSVAALARQLRAALTGILQQLAPLQTPFTRGIITLTKHPQNVDTASVPPTGGAGAPKSVEEILERAYPNATVS